VFAPLLLAAATSAAPPAPRYSKLPDLASCEAGRLSDGERDRMLALVNEIRSHHSLPAVAWDESGAEGAAGAALIMAAGLTLTHLPPKSLPCWTEAGAAAARESNLHLAVLSKGAPAMPFESALREFLADPDDPSLGHRRWILDPFVSKVSIGIAEGIPAPGRFQGNATAFALRLIGGPAADLSKSTAEWVACPAGEYPRALVPETAAFSFSVIADRADRAGNGIATVDLSKATVSMTSDGGEPIATKEVTAEYTGYGIPNLLRWRCPSVPVGRTVTVTIEGVRVRGEAKRYRYTVRLI
jgi:hypothetical protein